MASDASHNLNAPWAMLRKVSRGEGSLPLMPLFARVSQAAAIAATVLILPATASSQEQGRPNLFESLFGGNTAQPPAPARRGVDEAD